MSEWEKLRWEVGMGGELKVGYTIHWNIERIKGLCAFRNSHSVHVSPRCSWQQFDTACSLSYRIIKMMLGKADLAICSSVISVPG